MIYPFHCNSCNREFELEMPLDEYISHSPRAMGKTYASRFFQCTHCGSRNTRRNYYWAKEAIQFKGDGFTLVTKEEE